MPSATSLKKQVNSHLEPLLFGPFLKFIFTASNKTLTHQLNTPNRIGMKAANPSSNWGTFVFSHYGLADLNTKDPFSATCDCTTLTTLAEFNLHHG
jgi:hypothetical protein